MNDSALNNVSIVSLLFQQTNKFHRVGGGGGGDSRSRGHRPSRPALSCLALGTRQG